MGSRKQAPNLFKPPNGNPGLPNGDVLEEAAVAVGVTGAAELDGMPRPHFFWGSKNYHLNIKILPTWFLVSSLYLSVEPECQMPVYVVFLAPILGGDTRTVFLRNGQYSS